MTVVSAQTPSVGSRRKFTIRRLVLGLCLAALAVLFVGNLLYAALGAGEAALAGNPGDLLYLATFSDSEDGWKLYGGQQSARIADQKLELAVSTAQTATWSSARYVFQDFDVSVEARAVAGPIDNAFGLIFGLQETPANECDLPAVILCGIESLSPLAGAAMRQTLSLSSSRRYYAFLISSDGYYSLWHTVDGQSRALSAWIPSPQINQGLGAINIIRAIGHGASFRFFINGAPVALCLPTDASAASTYYGGECIEGMMRSEFRNSGQIGGKIGLVAQATATGGGGVVVRFDNLIVFQPTGGSEDAKL